MDSTTTRPEIFISLGKLDMAGLISLEPYMAFDFEKHPELAKHPTAPDWVLSGRTLPLPANELFFWMYTPTGNWGLAYRSEATIRKTNDGDKIRLRIITPARGDGGFT